jgi:prevent-host-death family protein
VRKAGIREARQDLSSLLEEVRKGREIVITEHGRPVARLVPAGRGRGAPFPDLSAFRRRMPKLRSQLSLAIIEDRGDRF